MSSSTAHTGHPKIKICFPPHSHQVPHLPRNPSISETRFFFFSPQTSDPSNLPVSVLVHHLASLLPWNKTKQNKTQVTTHTSYLYVHLYFPHSLLSQQTIGSSLLKAHLLCALEMSSPSQGPCFNKLTLLSICLHLLHLCWPLPARPKAGPRRQPQWLPLPLLHHPRPSVIKL